MDIVVIGAGVTGVTTAYCLARDGHDVTVIERLPEPGQETSRANAAQRSYGYVYPWADPGMVRKAMLWMWTPKGPFKLKLPPNARTLSFLAQTWRHAYTPGLFSANERSLIRLGGYSRECFADIERQVALEFDGGHAGLIDLASDVKTESTLRALMPLLEEMDVDHRWLGVDEVYAHEPGLRRGGSVHGGLRISGDGTGDCHLFTQTLAAHCRAMGVRFLFDNEVVDAECRQGRVVNVSVLPRESASERDAWPNSEAMTLSADAFVVCAGCQSRTLGRLIGQRMPIYPVKGYSITAPLSDEALADDVMAPRSTVIDDRFKVVITRLGQRVRVAGFAELANFDRCLPASRIDTLKEAVDMRFPGVALLDQATPWAGFRPMTPDGPPILGRGKYANLLLNTGHGIFGWTFSAASAEITADLVAGRPPAIDIAPFRPERFLR
uniref:D-amino acid dehydrogenase n=1 Tax=Halomonas sp. TaxID=1486246 RepID=UPI00261FE23E|nr:D-amino acid dehydrogenase [Halomonas sp.]